MSKNACESWVACCPDARPKIPRAANGNAARCLLSTWVVLVILGASTFTLVPSSARAQVLPCASHHLSADDRTAVGMTAQAVLPRDARPVISFPCRNPDSASTWITTPKVRTADGVQQWRQFSCSRGDGPWQCEAPDFKQQIIVSLIIREKPHRVEINFDEATSPGRARALAERALEVYADPSTQMAACDHGTFQAHDDSLPSFWTKPIAVTVSHDGVQDQVYLEGTDVVLEFSGTTADRDKLELLCWGTKIVVT